MGISPGCEARQRKTANSGLNKKAGVIALNHSVTFLTRTYLNINKTVYLTCRCKERSDEAIHGVEAAMDCRGASRLTMTISLIYI